LSHRQQTPLRHIPTFGGHAVTTIIAFLSAKHGVKLRF
jgi:hypothetical protein